MFVSVEKVRNVFPAGAEGTEIKQLRLSGSKGSVGPGWFSW